MASLEAESFWFRARNELILWALCRYCPNVKSFLEIGCGTGFVLSGIAREHPKVKLSGSEIFLEGLPYASQRVPEANLMQMDARKIPFRDEFDAVGAFDVIEHIDEDEAVLAELYRALKPGGLLLLTVPQHPWLWSTTDDYACHVRRYTARELQSKTRDAGFEVIRSTSFVSLLLPIMMLSRLGKKQSRRGDPATDPYAELRLSKRINQFLYYVMAAEGKLIRVGLNFPVGGSRLMIARKVG